MDTSGAIDLRPRIVGARLLNRGLDPYFHKWTPEQSPALLDPLDFSNQPISRVSVSPAVLMLHCFVADWDYARQQRLWFTLQWSILILSIVVMALAANAPVHARLIAFQGLFFVAGSYYWLLHLERGQVYIVYAFMIVLAYGVLKSGAAVREVAAGAILGILICLRIPAGAMLIPLAVYGRWRILKGAAIGFIIAVIITTAVCGPGVWHSYLRAMPALGATNRASLGESDRYYVVHEIRDVEGRPVTPKYWPIPTSKSSLQAIFDFVGVRLPSGVYTIALFAMLGIATYVLKRHRIRRPDDSVLFLTGATLVMLVEILLPPNRWTYANVVWFPLFSLIIINIDKVKKSTFMILLTGLILNNYFGFIAGGVTLGEWLVFVSIVMLTRQIVMPNVVNTERLKSG